MSGVGIIAGSVGAGIAIIGIAVAIAGLSGSISLTAGSSMSIVTLLNNPVLGLGQFIIGILGLTGHASLNAVCGFMLASQLITLGICIATILMNLSCRTDGRATC